MSDLDSVQSTPTDSVENTPPVDERDALIKAAAEVAADEPKEGEEKPVAKKPAPPKDEEAALPKLAAILRAKEQAQKLREEGSKEREEAQKVRQEAEKLKEEYAQALAEMRRERERIEMLKKDPMRAIKEIGWSADDLINGVLRENTPEWQALSKQEQEFASHKNEVQELKSLVKQLVERETKEKEASQKEVQQYVRQQTVQKFLTEIASEEKCPNLRALYDDDEIVAKGDRVADLYKERTGKVAPLADIAEYLEAEAEKRAAKLRGEARGKGHAPKVTANGPRTLTAASASERRATPKNIRELSPEEERDALIAAAKEATHDA